MKKLKKLLTILCFILLCFSVFAQAPEWQWATQTLGIEYDTGYGIAMDDAGNIYVTGSFCDIATFGSNSLISFGSADIFIAKMDEGGNWIWASQSGGIDYDLGIDITVDSEGNTYITGIFGGTASFGPYSLTSNGELDIFVAKMDENGNWLWATRAGGSNWDGGNAITIDDIGNSYITGHFNGTATFDSYSLNSSGEQDIFVAKMDENGNWLWVSQAGGSDWDVGLGIIIDNAGNSYVTGGFEVTSSFGSFSLTSCGHNDIFVAKMDSNGNWLWATRAGGSDSEGGKEITIDNAGNSYVTGQFNGNATFGSYSFINSGSYDIYVAKMDENGNWLWATSAGGNDFDVGNGITLDEARNSYVTGRFTGTATFGSYSLTSNGSYDIFVAKMDENGNWLWATSAGGNDWDAGNGITLDETDNSYVTGQFEGTASFGSYSLTSSGYNDIFVAKLNGTLSAENEIIPTINCLSNYPNPFNPTTIISYELKKTGFVNLKIYNLKGQLINNLVNKEMNSGKHSIEWNAESFSSGQYFYQISIDGKNVQTKKAIYLK